MKALSLALGKASTTPASTWLLGEEWRDGEEGKEGAADGEWK